jgi:asparagine synthase (glutamine-hydrolysing)
VCGITGIYSFTNDGNLFHQKIEFALKTLKLRGPNSEGVFHHESVSLAHTRLSVIDTSEQANQPFFSSDNNYVIVFNGEFFNYKQEREKLKHKYNFSTNSDTEVLLYMYIEYGKSFLSKINGCFSLAIYNKQTTELLLARDRFGIKPLIVYSDQEKLIFASEMKAIMTYDIKKEIDYNSLLMYFQLNYIPAPNSIFKNTFKLTPGTFLLISKNGVKKETYYKITYTRNYNNLNYEIAKKQLVTLLNNSVEQRMVADVALGTFLSGGIDSSIITGLASQKTNKLNSFSIGYTNEPFYDETKYALLVAKKFNTEHSVFKLTNTELYENLFNVLNYIDEPFADSSAIPIYILSNYTKQKVTVALSGDGADEIFSGYNKHLAHYKASANLFSTQFLKFTYPLTNLLPKSRNSKITNIVRQANKFTKGAKLNNADRYWLWASFFSENDAINLLNHKIDLKSYNALKSEITEEIKSNSINDILFTDVNLVLQNDMLAKVDLMSMANSLEVRVPFLDHSIVDFAFSLPQEYKINGNIKKRIVQDAFRNFLPNELYNRPKHGFEVPLLKWFKTDLFSLINNDLLNDEFILQQQIFNPQAIKLLKNKLFSINPGDVHTQIWALIVFQYWWKKYMQ